MSLSVREIASIMRQYGSKVGNLEWEKAAKLQDIWFSFPKHVATPVAPERFDYSVVAWPNQSGITIDWILKSDVDNSGRAKTAFGILQALVVGGDEPMKTRLKQQIDEMFKNTSDNVVRLGQVRWSQSMDVKAFHAQRVQSSDVQTDPMITPLDPLLGTLGSFNFYAIPIGTAKKMPTGSVQVDITDFVFYVIDSFDFEGAQALGFFKAPDGISKNPIDGGDLITNGDYRDFRDSSGANGKGGDFLVVSDARTTHLPTTLSIIPDPTTNGTWLSLDPRGRFRLAIKGNTVDWTETGPDTGIVYKTTLPVVQVGDSWRIERPNNDVAVLKMLGFQDATLQQAILSNGPRPSVLSVKLQEPKLVAKWAGIRVKKKPNGSFDRLIQPEDPSNTPSDYGLSRA